MINAFEVEKMFNYLPSGDMTEAQVSRPIQTGMKCESGRFNREILHVTVIYHTGFFKVILYDPMSKLNRSSSHISDAYI